MHAAVVSSFDHPPRYETVEAPEARDVDEVVVDVLAAGAASARALERERLALHEQRRPPLIPGIDGVGTALLSSAPT